MISTVNLHCTQDENRTVTAEYTVTVPKLVVNSENFNIVNGVVKRRHRSKCKRLRIERH